MSRYFFMSTSLSEGQLKRVFELQNLAKDLTTGGKVEQPIVTKSCKRRFQLTFACFLSDDLLRFSTTEKAFLYLLKVNALVARAWPLSLAVYGCSG